MANELIQNLLNADIDAIAFSEWWLADADAVIERRLAPSVNSFQYWVDYMANLATGKDGADGESASIESLTVATGAAGTQASVVTGGTPTARTFALTIPRGDKGVDGSYSQKAYTTEALMIADKANIPANTSVDVTNDTAAKNGTYAYNGTTFTKSVYDPVALSKTYTDNSKADTLTKVVNAFDTKDLMVASPLVDGSHAKVDSDSTAANNGDYKKSAGAWVKSAYDPVVQSKNYVDNGVAVEVTGIKTSMTIPTLVVDDLPTTTMYADTDGIWRVGSFRGRYVLNLLEGDTLRITANSTQDAYYALLNGFPVSGSKHNAVFIPKGTTATIIVPSGIDRMWFSDTAGTTVRKPEKIVAGSRTSVMKDDVIDNVDTAAKKLPLSANAGKVINDNLKEVRHFLTPYKAIEGSYFTSTRLWSALLSNNPLNLQGYEVVIKKGDKLTFDYKPKRMTTMLWDYRVGEGGNGWALLTPSITSDTIRKHEFTAYSDMVVRLVGVERAAIKVNAVTPTIVDLGAYAVTMVGSSTPNISGRLGVQVSLKAGDTVKITSPAFGSFVIADASTNFPIFSVPSSYVHSQPVIYKAETDIQVNLYGLSDSQFLIRRYAESDVSGSLYDTALSGSSDPKNSDGFSDYIPASIQLTEYTDVMATYDNFIIKNVYGSANDEFAISTDLGDTWTYIPNTIGKVSHFHFFGDGTIMLCGQTKVYWTNDYLTLNESTLLNEDGSPFTAADTKHFFCSTNGDSITMTPRGEIYAWGEYRLGGRALMWYTVDRGRTVKVAAAMGITPIGDAPLPVRHFHRVIYRSKEDCYYISTGDVDDESAILKGYYDWDTDTWSFDLLNKGRAYKFGAIFFDGVFAYVTTDYTDAEFYSKQGMYKVLPEFLGDITKYQRIYNPKLGGAGALSRILMDAVGNKILFSDGSGTSIGKVWLARNNFEFKPVTVVGGAYLLYFTGANFKGDIYCMAYKSAPDWSANLHMNNGRFINLTKTMRDAGIKNFMKGQNFMDTLGGFSNLL